MAAHRQNMTASTTVTNIMRSPAVVASLLLALSSADFHTSAFQFQLRTTPTKSPPSCGSVNRSPGSLIPDSPRSSYNYYDWSRSYATKSADGHAENAPPSPLAKVSINSLLENRRIDDAVKELRNSGGDSSVPASTYHAVIEACCAGGVDPKQRYKTKSKHNNKKSEKDRIDVAVELMESMKDDVTTHAHEIIISGYARRGRWQDAYRTLSSMEELFLSNKTKNTPSADGKDANNAITMPSLNVYQTVLTSFAKANQFNHLYSLLTRMRRGGVRPTVYTYNSILKICASENVPRWKEALSILSQCQREPGASPDLITYTTAMKACARGRQAGKAMELFRAVQDMNMELDVYAYTTAMDACSKGRQWRKALSLMDEMKERGIAPNEVTYGVAVAACGNGGQWKRALELLDVMRGAGLKINTITYNAAIAALAKAAREFKRQQHGATTGEVDVTMNVLCQKALDLVDVMKDEGVRRDSFTFSSAISTCGSAGRWEESVGLIKAMKGDGTKPNRVAYTAAITACANSRQWGPAYKLFNEMKNDRLQPDLIAYNALIKAGMSANKPEEVFDLWQEMNQPNKDNVSPDIVTLTEVVATLDGDGARGKVNRKRVDGVFEEAVSKGLILRKDSLDTSWEVDLSKMSAPVARAACRYIFKQIVEKYADSEADVKDLTLITGPSKMREHVRGILQDDLKPVVYCVVPESAKGTLMVMEKVMKNYIAGQGKQ